MNMKRILPLLLAGLMVLSLGACKGANKDVVSSSAPEPEIDPNYPVAIGDIRVAARPEAIVSLSPALTEVICELGGRDRLVGVSDFCDFPQDVADAVACGTAQTPNFDQMKSLAPEVVFASAALSEGNTIKLQQMGAEVVVLPHADSVDALDEIYSTVGTILDGMIKGDQNAKGVFAPLRATYDAVVAAAGGITPVPAIYLRATPLTMATGDTFEGKLLEELGFTNAAADYAAWDFPADKAAELYPDVIFYDASIDPQSLKDDKVYNTTNAVKNDRLYPVEGLALERQSARFFETLLAMFELANPDVTVDVTAMPNPEAEPKPESAADEPSSKEQAPAASADEEVLDLGDMTKVTP